MQVRLGENLLFAGENKFNHVQHLFACITFEVLTLGLDIESTTTENGS